MTYTTDQVVQMAREVGAFMEVLFAGRHDNVVLTESELTNFANLIRDETLLEAAEMFRAAQMDDAVFMLVAYRMAGEE